MPARLTGLKVFWPGVEVGLKIGLALVLLVVVVLPLAWGYRQHAEAELWRDVACTYRLKEALRDRLISQADLGGRPCARLDELGLGFAPLTAWPSASVSE
jgi:hypothetical protein